MNIIAECLFCVLSFVTYILYLNLSENKLYSHINSIIVCDSNVVAVVGYDILIKGNIIDNEFNNSKIMDFFKIISAYAELTNLYYTHDDMLNIDFSFTLDKQTVINSNRKLNDIII